jgi:hypothetical protein
MHPLEYNERNWQLIAAKDYLYTTTLQLPQITNGEQLQNKQ